MKILILTPEISLIVFNKITKKSYVYSHDLLDASIINKGDYIRRRFWTLSWKTNHVEVVITKTI